MDPNMTSTADSVYVPHVFSSAIPNEDPDAQPVGGASTPEPEPEPEPAKSPGKKRRSRASESTHEAGTPRREAAQVSHDTETRQKDQVGPQNDNETGTRWEDDGDDLVVRIPRPKRKTKKKVGEKEVVRLSDLPSQAQDSSAPLPPFLDSGRAMSVHKAEVRAWAASLLPKEVFALENPPPPDGWNLLAREILTNMVEHPGCLLLTRVGSFYEAYMTQAQELARLTNIRCAKTSWRGRKVEMAGFPCIQLPKYVDLLVRTHGRLVAICDEFILSPASPAPAPASGKRTSRSKSAAEKSNAKGTNRFDYVQVRKPLAPVSEPSRLKKDDSIARRVTEVISPGTLVDDSLVDPYVNNYLLAISVRPCADRAGEVAPDETGKNSSTGATYGLAWLDLGTTTFSSTTCTNTDMLRDEVARISPREIVLPDGVFGTPLRPAPPTPGPIDEHGWPSFPPAPLGAFGEELPYQRFDSPLWEVVGDSRISFVSHVFATDPPSSSAFPEMSPAEREAIGRLKDFLSRRFLYRPNALRSLGRPGQHHVEGEEDVFTYLAIPAAQRQNTNMRIDAHTLAALEVRRVARGPQELAKAPGGAPLGPTALPSAAALPLRSQQIAPPGSGQVGSVGSLLHAVRRTVTRGGARLLERWLLTPSIDVVEIHRRHNVVSFFLRHAFLNSDLRLLFKASANVSDSRIVRSASQAGAEKTSGTKLSNAKEAEGGPPLWGLSGGADPIRAMIKSRTISSTREALTHVLLFLRLVENVRSTILSALPDVEAQRIELEQSILKPGRAKFDSDLDLAAGLIGSLDPLKSIASELARSLIADTPSDEADEPEEASDVVTGTDLEDAPGQFESVAESQPGDPKDKMAPGAGVPPLRLRIRPESYHALSTLVNEYENLRRKAIRMEAVLRLRLPEPEQRRLSLRSFHGRGPTVWVDRLSNSMAQALAEPTSTPTPSYPLSTVTTAAEHAEFDADEEGRWSLEPVRFSARKGSSNTRGAATFLPWTDLWTDLTSIREAIRSTEDDILTSLTEQVWGIMPALRANAAAVDQLDVLLSFAVLASEKALIRPEIYAPSDHTEELKETKPMLPELDLRDVRHLVVEATLESNSRTYTPNDVVLAGPVRAGVITGPNMGGKSTLLRAVAHAVLLAQAGSFVPALSARLGVVDGLYARVGARDALWNDQSTFMLEMLETAHFLNHATRHSVVIADEIGRGTTAETGLAIAHATLLHLTHTAGARTLFATHFHPLVALLGYPQLLAPTRPEDKGAAVPSRSQKPSSKGESSSPPAFMTPAASTIPEPDPAVTFWCTDAKATPNGVVFDHRLRPGVNTNSYGLLVARLAGVSPQVVSRAQKTLDSLLSPAEPTKLT